MFHINNWAERTYNKATRFLFAGGIRVISEFLALPPDLI